MTELLFFNVKTTKRKKNNLALLTEKTLIGINLYRVLFLYLFIQFIECSC